MKRDPNLRVFVRLDKSGNTTSHVVFRRHNQNAPKTGRWLEISNNVCCDFTTTTTTTTTTTSTTTTTTTTE